MAQNYGNTYDDSGAIREDLLDILTKVNKNATPLVNLLEDEKATNTTHIWPSVIVSPSVTGYGSTGIPTQNAQVEGATITMQGATPYTNNSNYTQISYIPFNISETQQYVVYAGVPNILEDQAEIAMKRLGQDFENALMNGTASAGSSTTARQMNGMGAFCAAGQTYAGSAATFATTTGNSVLEQLLQKIYTASTDHADFVLVNPANKTQIDGWTANVTRYQEADKYMLSAFINVYQSSFGVPGGIKLIIDNFINQNTFNAGKLEDFHIAFLRRPVGKKLATLSDGMNFYTVLEATLELRNPVAAGQLTIS